MKSNNDECVVLDACTEALEFIKKTYGEKDFNLSNVTTATMDWASWLLWKKDKHLLVQINAGFAKHVLPIYEKTHPTDLRVRNCIDVTLKWSQNEATDAELDKARAAASDAASAAARDAEAASDDAWDAGWAASAAARAARDAAAARDAEAAASDAEWDAVRAAAAAARAAASAAAAAAWAASPAASDDAGDAAEIAEAAWQLQYCFKQVVGAA